MTEITEMSAAITNPIDNTLGQRVSATSIRRRTIIYRSTLTKSKTRQRAIISDDLIIVRVVLANSAILVDSKSAFNNTLSTARETTTRISIITPLKLSS
jgi:hypothetical protein